VKSKDFDNNNHNNKSNDKFFNNNNNQVNLATEASVSNKDHYNNLITENCFSPKSKNSDNNKLKNIDFNYQELIKKYRNFSPKIVQTAKNQESKKNPFNSNANSSNKQNLKVSKMISPKIQSPVNKGKANSITSSSKIQNKNFEEIKEKILNFCKANTLESNKNKIEGRKNSNSFGIDIVNTQSSSINNNNQMKVNNYLGSKEDINILGLNKFPLNLEVEV